MSDESEDECPACPAGIPAWVMTFADLMSLLMCFFVLLLSFSEMDVMKYKQLAGSMAFAFGVQNKVDIKDIPRGTSIIAQEFSPGRPQPTPLNVVKQETNDMTQSTLNVFCEAGDDAAEEKEKGAKSESTQTSEAVQQHKQEEMIISTQDDARKVAVALQDQIKSGQLEIETRGRKIVIRVKERGSFSSGSATLRPEFFPIMDKIRAALEDIPGKFNVEGHTDDIPISTPRFRSNWDLSSARAVSVAHELIKSESLDERRFTVVGFADTRPLVPNSEWRSRAKNRRVEIVVEQGNEPPPQQDMIDTGEIGDSDLEKLIEELESREQPMQFDFAPDELF